MKRFFIIGLLLSSYLSNAQNSMLNGDFWKSKPDVTTVKAEILKGNSPSEANRGNHDVVSFAINNDASLETIIYLINQDGNSISKNTHDGRLYIHWAANRGNLELVNYLLKQGSEIDRTDDKGAIPLAFAASNGQVNPKIYESFFGAGLDPKYKNANGATLMLMAVGNDKDLSLTEYLTSKGLSIKDVDSFGNTIFDYAARNGNIDILKKLQNKGIKPTSKAVIFASEGTRGHTNSLQFYKYLVEDLNLNPKATGDNGENVLHNLVKKKDQEQIIAYFIEKGVDVNQVNKEGNTVLMEAAKGTNITVLNTIHSKSKNINQRNKNGLSALSFAVNNGSADVVTELIKNKADLQVHDNAGNNLAYYLIQSYRPARQNQKDEFSNKIASLQKAGLSFSNTQKDGNTLLHLAVSKHDLDLFKKLEQFNINVNEVNEEGMTALHKAALIAKDDSILKYLIFKGADVKIKTEFDETAYDLASENEILVETKTSLDFLK